MSPKKLLVLLGTTLLAPCAGAEGGTHATGLGAFSSTMSSWNKQGPRHGVLPPVDGALPRCGALSSPALCVRARGGASAEMSRGFFAESGKPVTGSSSSSSQVSSPAKNVLRSLSGRAMSGLSNPLRSGARSALAASPAAPVAGDARGDAGPDAGRSERLREAKPKPAAKWAPAMREEGTTVTRTLRAAAVAAVTRGGGGDGGGMGPTIQGLVPDNPQLRGAGVLALAGLGNGALYALASKNLLRADWIIPFVQPWQVLTAATWAANMAATFSKGRLDGSSSSSSSTDSSSSGSGGKKKSLVPEPVRFFTPAGWAFAIWGPIFLGEFLFVLFQLMPVDYVRESWWLSDISPWFAGAMLFQSLWCASFRPWARDAGLLWVPTAMLGGVAVALGGVHSILRKAWFAKNMDILQYVLAHVPISLHFGWITCASLVNLNGFFASIPRLSNGFKLGASVCTAIAATVLGAVITYTREDPIFVAVLAWALWAVGSPAGWSDLKGRVDPSAIRRQELTAKGGAIFSMAAACLVLALSLKAALLGGD